jgi:adenylate cyclase, class 2
MQNVEYKAELKDPALARTILAALGATAVATLEQTDTYYRVTKPRRGGGARAGRLKKRETVGEATEWIAYEREDQTRPKLSRFKIYSENEARERFPESTLERGVVVRKMRELYLLDHVRVHLDRVEGLGTFLEFEALVSPRQNEKQCHEIVERLRRELRPALGEGIAVGYADLLAAGGDRSGHR